ncbi:MAG TPA: spore coat protein CotH, partial [Coriobacteriia bacterium]|nr:spore coat protein CotH [Coriobacteriia bacterium]
DTRDGTGFPSRSGGMGGMGAADGVSLVYIDDEQSSYSAIFDNAETNTNKSDHARVIEAIKNLNAGTELERYVDVDACLRYFAAHNVVINLDSYSGSMGHNYYLYENDGQIAILPWDYNMSFGGFQASNASDVVNFPLDTPVSGTTMDQRPLIAKLFEVPDYLDSYHTYVRNVMDGYFVDGLFEAKVDEIDTLIGASVAEDPSAFYAAEEYRAAVLELKKLGDLRAQSVTGQLNGSIPTTTKAQQADDSALIDASSLNLQTLGSSNMGSGGGGMGGGNIGDGGFAGRGGQRPESAVQ